MRQHHDPSEAEVRCVVVSLALGALAAPDFAGDFGPLRQELDDLLVDVVEPEAEI